MQIQESFPIIIRPEFQSPHLQDHLDLLLKDHSLLEKLLLKNGAIIFRNFPLQSAQDFDQFIQALNLGKTLSYIGGDSPREKIFNNIYTSTEAPPSFHIPLHQELSYLKTFPKHIYFFCEIAPHKRGETIIADARKIYQRLNQDVIQRFHEKGLTYISNYYFQNKLLKILNRSHKSWLDVFETPDKQEVEKLCQASDISWKWLPKSWIEIKQQRTALLDHPITKETVWFNQAHHYDFNPKFLGFFNYLATKILYLNSSKVLHKIAFGDGSPVPRQDLYHILDVLNVETVAPKWHRGDVMVLDNVLAMHGRTTFQGPRRILTALTS